MEILNTGSVSTRVPATLLLIFLSLSVFGCARGESVVRITTVENGQISGLDEEDMARISELKKSSGDINNKDIGLETVIQETPNYSVSEYLKLYPEADNPGAREYRVGENDIIEIMVYEEPDLSRNNVRISTDGYISYPFIGRVKIADLTVSEIEQLIASKLSEGEFIHNAHISVTVNEFRSKTFMVLGSVNNPGSFSLESQERILNAISKAGGLDNDASNQGILIRTIHPNTPKAAKQVVWIDMVGLLNEGDPTSNLPLMDKDLLYIPKTDHFYIIGQIQNPGSYPYTSKRITLIEAISMAGSFTPLAAPNKTRILRVENGVEQIIEVKVNTITEAGKKGQDVLIKPGDVIIVPESLF